MRLRAFVSYHVFFRKLLCNFFAYFKTVVANAWAYPCLHVTRLSAEFFHFLNRLFHDAIYGASPPAVGRSYHASLGVGQQHRHAIGCVDAHYQSFLLRNHSVYALKIFAPVHNFLADCGMGLPWHNYFIYLH